MKIQAAMNKSMVYTPRRKTALRPSYTTHKTTKKMHFSSIGTPRSSPWVHDANFFTIATNFFNSFRLHMGNNFHNDYFCVRDV